MTMPSSRAPKTKTRASNRFDDSLTRPSVQERPKYTHERARHSSKRSTSPGLPRHPKQFLLTPPTPSDVPADRHSRWSDIVPPQTGLTFAAIWDPNDGMVTFSGPELRTFPDPDADTGSFHQPSTTDGQSQVLTIDRLAMGNAGTGQNSAVWALEAEGGAGKPWTFACDALMDAEGQMEAFWVPGVKTPRNPIHLQLPARSEANSVRKSLFRTIPKEAREGFDWNTLAKLDKQLLKAPHDAFADACMNGDLSPPTSSSSESFPTGTKRSKRTTVGDEGFFEGGKNRITAPLADDAVLVELNMSSKFSMTTTSTSNYVEVTEPHEWEADDHSMCSSWSTVNAPDALEYMTSRLNTFPRRRRTLRKRRTRDTPACPIEVLAREGYNYHIAPPPEPGVKEKVVKKVVKSCLDGVKRYRKQDDERWVNVEIKQMVIQKLV